MRLHPCWSRLQKFWRTETIVFLGIWFGLLVAGRSGCLGDPGTLWHIATGERVLSTGALIHTDPFSCVFAGQPWIPQSWFPECVLAVLNRLAGLDAVLLATATLLACLYTWVAHRLLRAGLHPLVAVLLTGLAMAASSYQFLARPLLITLVLVGWTFAQLCDFEAGRIPLHRLFWLVPLFVLWTNCHAGMLGGLGTLGITVAGWGIGKFLGLPTPLVRYRQLIPLAGLILACALAAFINPYGAQMPQLWLSLANSAVVPRVIQEHRPLLAFWPVTAPVLLLGLMYVVALAGVLPARPRVTWLVPLVWFGLAWTRIRHGPLFAITAVLALPDMFPHIRWAAWLARRGSITFRLRVPDAAAATKGWDARPAVVPVVLVLTAILLQLTAVPVAVLGRGWARPSPRSSPLELLPELRAAADSRPGGTPIFNEMRFGGFLIYYTPELRVFMDDRCELCGDRWLERLADATWYHPEQIEPWAEAYGFDCALVEHGSVFDRYLRSAPGWKLLAETSTAALYRRDSGSTPRREQHAGRNPAEPTPAR